MSQAEFAVRVPAAVRTVYNVENGLTAVLPTNRPAWERALEWPTGSLAAAYARGVKPGGGNGDGGQGADVLDEAGIPEHYRTHPDVVDVVSSSLPADDMVSVLRVWLGTHEAFERSFSTMRDLRRAR